MFDLRTFLQILIMKRLLFTLAIAMATFNSLQAASINEAEARQVADKFFSAHPSRMMTSSAQLGVRLAYTAERGRFYVYDRGRNGGFVVVAGDDRLPQVLGYGDRGDFSTPVLPSSVQYWMNEMNRQIQFMQSHEDVVAHQPVKRATAVGPLMTTLWNQESPYNDLCPTYTDSKGNVSRAVTGCVATACAQVMNYHQWPEVGRGSHSYVCNVNDMTVTELSADFSQSHYRWDLMLDTYDATSSAESCEAVARLMSDVGIAVDMGYGSSSGAYESTALQALKRYFKYGDNGYLLHRDYYSAAEWDQLLVDEISALRPIVYCGYDLSGQQGGGHAFVFDGFDADGYYHVNWGWGGDYDGYFLVTLLNPGSSKFNYMQDGIFGLIPETQNDAIDKVLYIHSQLVPKKSVVPLGETAPLEMDNFYAEGNMLDTAGYEERNNRRFYYALIPMSIGVFDKDGVERQHKHFSYQQSLDDRWFSSGEYIYLDLSQSLEDGDYQVRLSYSTDGGNVYDRPVLDFSGKEVYVKMQVRDGTAYLTDCFLSNTYSLDSFVVPNSITIGESFSVKVNLTYKMPWLTEDGPVGNVYLSLSQDGNEVVCSEMCEVMVPTNTVQTYEIQMTAPAQWGRYDLVLKDESGNKMMKQDEWYSDAYEFIYPAFVLPVCQHLVEDFESMEVNSRTNDKQVQGQFTTWSFNKCGVRAPGEGRCNGTNAIMMKKASSFYNDQPLRGNFFMAQANIFNQSASAAKYTLEYSLDGGTTWQRVTDIDDHDAIDVPEKSTVNAMWMLHLTAAQPALFRVAMIAGSAATYIDDFALYHIDSAIGDVNSDGEVNVADVNTIIDTILTVDTLPAADVNGDGEINIADINTLIDMILK